MVFVLREIRIRSKLKSIRKRVLRSLRMLFLKKRRKVGRSLGMFTKRVRKLLRTSTRIVGMLPITWWIGSLTRLKLLAMSRKMANLNDE